ncbi:MAG: hypothetical protein J6V01_01665, partial [Clostridia bacterium]|nr:hypothetical protein [Clostridia bacterium]
SGCVCLPDGLRSAFFVFLSFLLSVPDTVFVLILVFVFFSSVICSVGIITDAAGGIRACPRKNNLKAIYYIPFPGFCQQFF